MIRYTNSVNDDGANCPVFVIMELDNATDKDDNATDKDGVLI